MTGMAAMLTLWAEHIYFKYHPKSTFIDYGLWKHTKCFVLSKYKQVCSTVPVRFKTARDLIQTCYIIKRFH